MSGAVRHSAVVHSHPPPTTLEYSHPARTGARADQELAMRALRWNGINRLGVEAVPDPTIVSPRVFAP
jgi:hypothetical protein